MADDRNCRNVVEGNGKRLPREMWAHIGAPHAGKDAERQSEVRGGERDEDVRSIVAPPWPGMRRPDLLGNDEGNQRGNCPIEQIRERSLDRTEQDMQEIHGFPPPLRLEKLISRLVRLPRPLAPHLRIGQHLHVDAADYGARLKADLFAVGSFEPVAQRDSWWRLG